MLKNLAKKLTNNLGLKVLALLFAIALWIVVVNIDDPVKPAQYTISVTQDNMDYLTSNGKYSETLGGKNTVTFTASAKRSILEKLSNTDFTAVADMEKIEYVEGDGICRVPITITCSKYNSNTVTISSKQQYLDVTVEDLGNVQKKITANTEGTVMNGCALGDVSIVTSNLLKISGPSSVTSQISTVVATINVDGMSSDVTDTVVPVLYDADGNEIDASKLKMNINTVTITAQILNTKDVDLSFQTKGNVASGYTLKGITYSPKKVRIKGETDVLNKVTKITIPDEVLDMSGATEDVETTVDITSYLPDGTSLVLAADAKVEVKVKVEPITTKTFEVDASAFTLENISDEAKAKITEETIEVEITGAESDIKKLSADDITGTVNLQGYGNGEHKVAADIDVDNELYQVKTVRIPVDITVENTENETKALLYLMGYREDSNEIYYFVIDFFNDVTGMSKQSDKLWDVQSKGDKKPSPKKIGEELVTLFKNYMSSFEFAQYIIFLGGVSPTLRVNNEIFEFGIENIKKESLNKLKEGLKEECIKKTYINEKDISEENINEFLKVVHFVITNRDKSEYVKKIILSRYFYSRR